MVAAPAWSVARNGYVAVCLVKPPRRAGLWRCPAAGIQGPSASLQPPVCFGMHHIREPQASRICPWPGGLC